MATKSKGKEFETTREQLHRQMLSTVSHDLKTPLATMIGSLEIYTRMHDRLTTEKRAALIQAALTEAYRLDSFITNILDMAKLEGGLVTVRSEPIDLRALLEDAVTRLGPRVKLHTVRFTPEGTVGTISSDPMMLGRAVGLVIDNATKHAGKEAIIDIRYGGKGTHFFIHISDNGAGIPPGKEEEIFSKYTRIARSDQQNAGTGLGLAICRQMMMLLGGTITAQNTENGGALFSLHHP